MKVGSVVLGLHIAVVCVFALTQGCVTSETQGSGRGAGARHKGPWKHEHKGKETPAATMVAQQTDPFFGQNAGLGGSSLYPPVVIDSKASGSSVEPWAGSSSTSGSDTYIVQKGDMLSKLAVRFDTTSAELIRMNNLSNPDVLYVGQELRVPAGRGGSSAKSTGSSKSSTSAVKKGGTYTIQKGDTLGGIALAAGVSIDSLRSLNNIKGDKIIAGETLDIPSGGKVPSASRKSSTSSAPASSSTTKKATAPAAAAAAPAATEPAPAPMAPSADAVEPVEAAPSMSVDMVEDHLMYPGESLDDVARQFGVSKSEIMRMNNITDETQVREGQRLRIPIAE